MKMDADKKLLKKTGLDFEVLNSGCCGMAGYFGYEKGDHYAVSVGAGERVLLPAVRKAEKNTIVIADGFSCREQIEQQTNRQGLHLAQVLDLALKGKFHDKENPEKKYLEQNKLTASKKQKLKRNLITGLVIGIAALVIMRTLISKNNE